MLGVKENDKIRPQIETAKKEVIIYKNMLKNEKIPTRKEYLTKKIDRLQILILNLEAKL